MPVVEPRTSVASAREVPPIVCEPRWVEEPRGQHPQPKLPEEQARRMLHDVPTRIRLVGQSRDHATRERAILRASEHRVVMEAEERPPVRKCGVAEGLHVLEEEHVGVSVDAAPLCEDVHAEHVGAGRARVGVGEGVELALVVHNQAAGACE